VRLLPIAIVLCVAPAAAADVPVLTHTTPLTPTGELVRPGHLQRHQNVVAFEHEYAIGTEHFELRLVSPVVPIPAMGGDLQIRTSLLPRDSRFRLVAGASVAGEWIEGGDLWLGGMLTAAYRGDGISAHATIRMQHHMFEGGDDLGLTTAGLVFAAGKHHLFIDVGELAWRQPGACPDPGAAARQATPAPTRCAVVDASHGVAFGAWFSLPREDMQIGISGMIFTVGDLVIPLLPMASFAWDY
jgi:hypothetical protein